MPEQLSFRELVDHLLTIEELDGSAPDDSNVILGRRALVKDHALGLEVLDLRPSRDLLDGIFAEPIEGFVTPEKLGDVVNGQGRIGRQSPNTLRQ